MATKEKNVQNIEGEDKPGNGKSGGIGNSSEGAAPNEEKSETAQEGLDEEDITDLISMLNLIQKEEGGSGDITDIPKNLRKVSRFLITKMIGLRSAFVDPLFAAILDDLVDQKEEGKTPSVIVAISRVVPLDKLQEVADNENYGEIQGGVEAAENERIAGEEREEQMNLSIDQFIASIDAYCKKMDYDETEKEALINHINSYINAFADMKLSEEEIKMFDMGRNYTRDMDELKSQIPSEPRKEIMPDKASVDESANPIPPKKKEMSEIERMAVMNENQTDITKVGERKRFRK